VTISPEELQLAARNHGMPLEALRWDVTPIGLHYLLVHYDVPLVEADGWRLSIRGLSGELSLSLEELQRLQTVTEPVTMECAGNGRALMEPRAISQPWLREAVGTGEWIGTPLSPLLHQVGIDAGVDVLFTGLDQGVEGGVAQAYARALPLAAATRPEVLLAWGLNGQPLPPQHGFPLRLVVPGWYGMTNVKWLDSIVVLGERYAGYQNEVAYRMRGTEEDPGIPITRMSPRSLMAPPGVPDFMSRRRHLPPGRVTVEGRAWSGWGEISNVEFAVDGEWRPAEMSPGRGEFAWSPWSTEWEATPGDHVLSCRCTDAAGNTQPDEPFWNVGGYANNAVQQVVVTVG
jgi:DMSO/TMAO reductase YedYZ molybdopterin-dependent catalytic subunit